MCVHVCVIIHLIYVWLCDHMDCRWQAVLTTSILQATILEWVAMPSSRGCTIALFLVSEDRSMSSWQQIKRRIWIYIQKFWRIRKILKMIVSKLTHNSFLFSKRYQTFRNQPFLKIIFGLSIPGSGRSAGEGIHYPLQHSWASLVAQLVKNPPAMQETWVWSPGWEDTLEKGKATHSSILAWRIPWTV